MVLYQLGPATGVHSGLAQVPQKGICCWETPVTASSNLCCLVKAQASQLVWGCLQNKSNSLWHSYWAWQRCRLSQSRWSPKSGLNAACICKRIAHTFTLARLISVWNGRLQRTRNTQELHSSMRKGRHLSFDNMMSSLKHFSKSKFSVSNLTTFVTDAKTQTQSSYSMPLFLAYLCNEHVVVILKMLIRTPVAKSHLKTTNNTPCFCTMTDAGPTEHLVITVNTPRVDKWPALFSLICLLFFHLSLKGKWIFCSPLFKKI